MAKHFSCKTDKHDACTGTILIGGPMRGIEGLKTCSCDCHRKPKNDREERLFMSSNVTVVK